MSVAIILALSLFGLAVAFYYSRSVSRVAVDMGVEDADTRGKLRKIHAAIAEGAMAFLKQEYKFMAIFMVLFGIVIALLIDDHHTENVNEGIYTAVAFIFGAIISIASGYIGMKIATAGNVRTTVSANQSLSSAFNLAMHSGAVMGFALVSLASLGMLLIYLGLKYVLPDDLPPHVLMEVIAGFGLGGSSIALFARVGGGIFTKAADVGADLVGKVEAGIPEDDPRNPAVIADNVGDNVGDVAGMGADLFGSCAESTCAAMVISAIAFGGNVDALLYPIVISAIGIPVSLIYDYADPRQHRSPGGPGAEKHADHIERNYGRRHVLRDRHAGAGGVRNHRRRVYLPRRIPVLPDRTNRRPRRGPAHRVLHVRCLQPRS